MESESIYRSLGSISSRVKRQYEQETGLEISLNEGMHVVKTFTNSDGYSAGVDAAHSPGSRIDIHLFPFMRMISVAPSSCGCKERENKCPAGEQGPKGEKGQKGEDGVEGEVRTMIIKRPFIVDN